MRAFQGQDFVWWAREGEAGANDFTQQELACSAERRPVAGRRATSVSADPRTTKLLTEERWKTELPTEKNGEASRDFLDGKNRSVDFSGTMQMHPRH
jgi:hypothetical protein